jgi:hypothetical protein
MPLIKPMDYPTNSRKLRWARGDILEKKNKVASILREPLY